MKTIGKITRVLMSELAAAELGAWNLDYNKNSRFPVSRNTARNRRGIAGIDIGAIAKVEPGGDAPDSQKFYDEL